MSDRWIIQRAGKKYGPMTSSQLRKLAASGQIRPSDVVQKEGMIDWVKAEKIKGLFPEPNLRTTPAATSPGESGSPSRPDSPPTRSQDQRLASWIFGSILMTFFLGVFLFAPKELPEFKQRMLAFSSAILAGLFGFFFTGQIDVEWKFIKQKFGDLGVKATGGAGLFVLVLAWWLSPLAPVKASLALKPIQFFAPANQISVLSGDVGGIQYSFDGEGWKPAEGFEVSTTGFQGVQHAVARLNPEQKKLYRKVYVKYTTTDGSESPVAQIAYDPNESIYPKAVQDSMNEAREVSGKAISRANETMREVSGLVGDFNTFHVKLDNRKLSRADLARLGKLPMLMTLDMTGSEFDDVDLAGLRPTSSLKSLSLGHSSITDRGLESVKTIRPLTTLDLSGTQVSDEGIAALSDLDDLRDLKLDGTQVTGKGFARFSGFFNRLSLRGSKLDDEGAKSLGAAHVAHAIASELDLGETKLTDIGLEHFESCHQLQKLKIDGTAVTAAGVASLKGKMPHLKIEW